MAMEIPYKTIKELKQAFKAGDHNAGKILFNFCETIKEIHKPKELKNCRNCGAPNRQDVYICLYCGTHH